jgi:hypothetical protein
MDDRGVGSEAYALPALVTPVLSMTAFQSTSKVLRLPRVACRLFMLAAVSDTSVRAGVGAIFAVATRRLQRSKKT